MVHYQPATNHAWVLFWIYSMRLNRKQIFEITRLNGTHNIPILNDNFEWTFDKNCIVQQKTDVMRSMTDYMAQMSGEIDFTESKTESSNLNVPLWPISLFVSYKETKAKSSSNSGQSNYEKQKKFFASESGEAYINKAKCIIYKVSINPFSQAVFTDGFKSGLRSLQRAARNPAAENSKKIRIEFLNQYGTHYQSECYLGASMTTITRMSSRSASQADESKRKDCVSKAYSEGTSKGVKVNEFDVSISAGKGPVSGTVGTKLGGWGAGSSDAYRSASSKCDSNDGASSAFASSGVEQSEIISVGVTPYTTKEQWEEAVGKTPSSMKFVLTDITNLFTPNNINHIPLDEFDPDGEKLDAALLKSFLQLSVDRYCNIVLGKPCPVPKSCSIWNDCSPGQRCVDDASTDGFHCKNENDFTKGKCFIMLIKPFVFIIISALLITGGFNANGGDRLSSVEVWAPGEDSAAPLHCNLPSMPRTRTEHTLTTGGGAAPLVCGGRDDKQACEQWTDSGWQELNTRLSDERSDHSAWWDNTTGTTYLMGGDGGETSIDTVSNSGSVGTPSWSLKYSTE